VVGRQVGEVRFVHGTEPDTVRGGAARAVARLILMVSILGPNRNICKGIVRAGPAEAADRPADVAASWDWGASSKKSKSRRKIRSRKRIRSRIRIKSRTLLFLLLIFLLLLILFLLLIFLLIFLRSLVLLPQRTGRLVRP
jgi:hypothetical protein